ncbi:sensor histidine kinase [Dyadobacter psychrophilus]|uniref:histidine kinase n=1 Tax=Dyadobacter psychrophilus TaxID=651661 RepID=A0A1T5HG59_9BACT|nr:HAMP domain-containing sensor histidine kinase [Dyadobacter psychrophilus]SKC19667.1 Signal transduction histidine kinase [Dyadobacter psychrophilus]
MDNVKRKLLHQTLRGYGLYAVLILLLSTPFFYFLIQKLHLDDVDEGLVLRADEFKLHILPGLNASEIDQWNRFNRDMKILKEPVIKGDSLSFQFYYDSLITELEPYRVLLSPVKIGNLPYTLSVKNDLIESEDLIMSLALLYSGLLVVLLAGLFYITKYYSNRLWLPFYNTLDSIEQYEIDKTHKPDLPDPAIQEFSRLNQSVQNLIDRSKVTYENQQEFIENAAHELQTPLAVLHAKLDSFLQLPDLTASQLAALSPLYDLLARLNRLNKNLLLLSKIDHQSYHTAERFDLALVIEKTIDFFEDQATEKNIRFEHVKLESHWVVYNMALVEILVSNLLLNALTHNREYGVIHIELKGSTLIISNTGATSTVLAAEKLFQRFAKTGSASKGNGLGLAIVKKITDLYGWMIGYSFEDGLHCFKVRF